MPQDSKEWNDEKKSGGYDDDSDAKAAGRSSDGPAKAQGKNDTSMEDDDEVERGTALIKKVIAYFFDDDAFAHTFEKFAEEHCHIFDLEEEEMKLEYTEIYNQFQALFESKLEAFIRAQGSSVGEFYQYIRDANERDRESSLVLCSEILVATADFDVFVLMMRQTKESMQLAKCS
ncbi:hypothetical protein Poli38472_001402 [Pythium oligandrum]|uniref:Cilia- and flagella-associated protein 36 n=1 Tax=Pythium oligandrum TaxID=41045 RepID=A0A8K1CSW5_PYTOL|nr:hypothetical protein Poli38472_001402 [Pythium oligandrum]|eukprot:TMW69246.1 hypothetical protein Poli38472_001402 [Pythium oligandrum]